MTRYLLVLVLLWACAGASAQVKLGPFCRQVRPLPRR
jgi:hypothetical protein